jgi:t-SNARE complex subunit (syntaxin)
MIPRNRIAGFGATPAPTPQPAQKSVVQSVVDTFNPITSAVTGATGMVTSAEQTVTDLKQAVADAKASAEEAKQAIVGYAATTVLLQGIIAAGVVFIGYQLWKANKRK